MNPFDHIHGNFDQNRLEQFMAAQQQKPTVTAQPQQQNNSHHNFFVDSLPTVLGTVGSIGGGLLGGFFGGGVGAVPGAAGGGAAGSAAGQWLENVLTGDNAGKDVGKEALLGGVFGAGPLRLGKFALGVPALLAGRGAEEAAGNAAGNVVKGLAENGAKTAAEQPLKTSTFGKFTTAGNKLLASQYGTIDKPVMRETNPMDTISKLADVGILKPTDAEKISHAITGSNGLLTQQVAKAVGSAGKVSTGNIENVFSNALAEHGIEPNAASALRNTLDAQMAIIAKEGNSPQTVLKVMQNLEKRAANLEGRGGNYRQSTPERVDAANVLRSVRNELQDQLYNASGGNKNLAGVLTPELRNSLVQLHPKSPQWKNYVDNTIMKSKSIGDLRSAQAPFVNISKIIENGDQNLFGFTGRVGNAFASPGNFKDAVLNAATGMVKDPAARAAGSTLRGVGTGQIANQALDTTAKGLTKATLGTGFKEGTANSVFNPRTLEGALMSGSMNPQGGQNAPQGSLTAVQSGQGADALNATAPAGIPGVSGSGFGSSPSGQPAGMGQISQSGSPYSQEALVYDIQRDPQNAAKYIDYYKQLDAIFNNPATSQKLNATQIQQQNTALSGMQSLQDISNFLQQNPNAPKADALPDFTHGLTGTGAYHTAIQNATDAIGRLRSGGAINADEEKRFRSFLPSAFDSPDTVQYKLNALNNIFARFADPQAASSSLEAALTQQGGY